MSVVLQVLFIIGIIFFFLFLIYCIKRNILSLKYSLLWIFSLFVMLIICIFPDILSFVAHLLGFEIASNALFSFLFTFVILLLISITSIVSKQSEKIKSLIQESALLEKRLRVLEEKVSEECCAVCSKCNLDVNRTDDF